MAYVPITVDGIGNANDPGVRRGDTVRWLLDTGVTGPFCLDPPPSMFDGPDPPASVTLTDQSSSPTYTVKHGASAGEHSYFINAGACAGKALSPLTGPQKITVTTGAVKAAGHS